MKIVNRVWGIVLLVSIYGCKRNSFNELIYKWRNDKNKCLIAEQFAKERLLNDKDTFFVRQNLGAPLWAIKRPPFSVQDDKGTTKFPYGRDSNIVFNYSLDCDTWDRRLDGSQMYYRIIFDSNGNVIHSFLLED
jgi:hypothetical protein